MKHSFVLTFCLLLIGPVGAAEQPNVLFIAVDDLNDWIGCLEGHPQASTPNMDRLAERGMLFTNAHCAAPACNPSRAAIFSGQLPMKTGVWSNDSRRIFQLNPNAKLLPMAFADAGYKTLGTGKMLHGGSDSEGAFAEFHSVEQRWSPFTKEAVRYTEDEASSKGTSDPKHVIHDSHGNEIILPLNRMPSDRAPTAPEGESFDWGPIDVPDSEMGDTQITDWAIDQLDAGFNKPFFLGIGYYRPHIPLFAPASYFERFSDSNGILPPIKPDDLEDLSPIARLWAVEPVTAGAHETVVRYHQWKAAIEAYLACVTFVDHEFGRLLDALDRSPFAENTLIVLWSDHGWHLGEKEHWGKWTGWERSTRVPLIIVPPKNLAEDFAPAGSRCDQPVSLVDLYPTLTEMCAVDPPEQLYGQSLVPLLKAPDRDLQRTALTLFDEGNSSLRTKRFRYVRYADGSEELYDHQSDPHEWENLADSSEYKQQLLALRKMLEEKLNRN